jgi:hypothetical protein
MTTKQVDTRAAMVAWANWFVQPANKKGVTYTEGPERMDFLKSPRGHIPYSTDCSGFVTMVCWCAGTDDPNGLGYDGEGYTGTLLSHELHVAMWAKNAKGITYDELIPGDLVVYGPGTGWHVGFIVEVHGPDVLTVSMGEQGDPSYVWMKEPTNVPSRGFPFDGREPQRYLRIHSRIESGVAHMPPAILKTGE